MMKEIRKVSSKTVIKFIGDWSDGKDVDKCRMLARDGRDAWIAVDNLTGDCWMEVFLTRDKAIDWLENRENENNEKAD